MKEYIHATNEHHESSVSADPVDVEHNVGGSGGLASENDMDGRLLIISCGMLPPYCNIS